VNWELFSKFQRSPRINSSEFNTFYLLPVVYGYPPLWILSILVITYQSDNQWCWC